MSHDVNNPPSKSTLLLNRKSIVEIEFIITQNVNCPFLELKKCMSFVTCIQELKRS